MHLKFTADIFVICMIDFQQHIITAGFIIVTTNLCGRVCFTILHKKTCVPIKIQCSANQICGIGISKTTIISMLAEWVVTNRGSNTCLQVGFGKNVILVIETGGLEIIYRHRCFGTCLNCFMLFVCLVGTVLMRLTAQYGYIEKNHKKK